MLVSFVVDQISIARGQQKGEVHDFVARGVDALLGITAVVCGIIALLHVTPIPPAAAYALVGVGSTVLLAILREISTFVHIESKRRCAQA